MKLLLKTKPRLWPSQWRLQATVLTNAHQANLKNFIYWTRNKQMYFSLPAWWSNSWSLQTNRHWSTIWSRILHRRMKIVDQYLVPHRNSENHAPQKGNLWNDMKFCKIEDRVRCQTCFKYQRPGETFCTCGSFLQGTTEGVTKQAEQRINSRFIMYVPRGHNLAMKKIPRSRRFWKSAEGSGYGTIVERFLEDEQYRMRMHEQGYTHSDMEEFDTIASGTGFTSLLLTKGVTTETNTKSCNPPREEATTP